MFKWRPSGNFWSKASPDFEYGFDELNVCEYVKGVFSFCPTMPVYVG